MEIIPSVHRISTGVSGANIYLLMDRQLTLIDTGMPGNVKAILDYVRSLGRSPSDLTRIVVTHHHIDHVGSLAELRQQTQAQVVAHSADMPFIAGERARPTPRGIMFQVLFRLVPAMSRYTPAPVDTVVQDGEALDILDGATVVHMPGHTFGSIALYFPASKMLIAGDTINHRGGRLALPRPAFTDDMPQAIASICKLADLEIEVLCPGHGDPIVGGAGQALQTLLQTLGH